MRCATSVVVLMVAGAFVAGSSACGPLLAIFGGNLGEDQPDAGLSVDGGKLKPCDCNPTRSVNANDPVCGCGERTPGSVGAGPTIGDSSYTSAVIDDAKDRLVVGVSAGGGLREGGALWTVDLKTGDRALFSGELDGASAGNGDVMKNVEDVDLGQSGLYVLEHFADDNGEQTFVQRIDPASGDRTTILAPDFFDASAIACASTATVAVQTSDANPSYGFAVGAGDELFFGVHLPSNYTAVIGVTTGATPACRVVSGDDGVDATDAVGAGDQFLQDASALSFADGAIFVYDFVGNAVFQVDPQTGARKIVSSPNHSVGSDADSGNICFPNFSQASELSVGGGAVWTPSGDPDIAVTKIDIATGKRSCIGGIPTGATIQPPVDFANVDTTGGVYLAASGLLLAVGTNAVWQIDPDVAVANVLSE